MSDFFKFTIHIDEDVFGDEEDDLKEVNFEGTAKIQELIDKVWKERKENDDPPEVMRSELALTVNGTYLPNDIAIKEAITNGSQVEIKRIPTKLEKFSGFQGNLLSTSFHNMTSYEKAKNMDTKKDWSKEAPEYRVMYPGFNIEVVCTNKKCDWNCKNQIIPMEFGRFDITEIFATTKCKNCKKKIEFIKFRRAGFTKCKYKFEYISEKFEKFGSEWILVPFKPCWLVGGINDEDSVRYRRLEFFVEKRDDI